VLAGIPSYDLEDSVETVLLPSCLADDNKHIQVQVTHNNVTYDISIRYDTMQ